MQPLSRLKTPQNFAFMLSLLIGFVACAPLFTDGGFLNTRHLGDAPFLLFRLHQLSAALEAGVFPVRWMSDAAQGLGYPFFHYYAALPYYLAAGLRALGFSYILSLKLTALLGFLLAAGAMYAWLLRLSAKPYVALLGSAAYSLMPYHLVNVYLRGDSLSEFWAMAWYPLILYALDHAAERPTRPRLATVALSYGALILTHNVSALIFSPFIALYGLYLTLQNKQLASIGRRFIALACAGLLGVGLAAWFWFPALNEQEAVQLDDQASGYFFYGNHFRQADLIQDSLLFDYQVLGAEANPLSMGLLPAVLITLGIMVTLLRLVLGSRRGRDSLILLALLLATFMITPHSKPLWEHLPLLELAQFPWRFLSVQALFGAAIIALLFDFSPRQMRLKNGLWAGAFLLIFALSLSSLARLELDFIALDDADVTPERLYAYEAFSGNIGTTVGYEYLPRQTALPPYSSDFALGRDPRPKFLNGSGVGELTHKGADAQTWALEVESERAEVALPLLYWAGWRAESAGQNIPLYPLEGIGYITVSLPQGAHDLRLWLAPTPSRFNAEWLSLLAVFISLALAWPWLRRLSWPKTLLIGAAILLSLALFARLIPASQSSDLITADYAQRAYFHQNPEGVTFEDGSSLQSAQIEIQNGQLIYDLNWQTPAERITRLELTPPLHQTFLGAPIYPINIEAATATQSGIVDLSGVLAGRYFFNVALFPPDADTSDLSQSIDPLTGHDYGRSPLHFLPVIVPPQFEIPNGLNFSPTENLFLDRLNLLGVTTAHEDDQLLLTLWWEVLAEIPLHYGLDLALLDKGGYEWLRANVLVGGGGLYPSGLWQQSEVVADTYRLTIPYGMAVGDYDLRLNLYDTKDLAPIAQGLYSGVYQPQASAYPCDVIPTYQLGEELFYNSISPASQAAQGEALRVEMDWYLPAPPSLDYQLEWTLKNGSEVAQTWLTDLAAGADLSAWNSEAGCGVYVLAQHNLSIPKTFSPDTYTLSLALLDADHQTLVDAFNLGMVEISGRERLFDLPPIDRTLTATFGDEIQLQGYSFEQQNDQLNLQLAWAAALEPTQNYKFFVHLYAPNNTDQVLRQIDAEPLGFTYPTSDWVAGEIVIETLSFDLSGLAAGDYPIGIGWYRPSDFSRLSITSDAGEVLPDQRLILPDTLTINP